MKRSSELRPLNLHSQPPPNVSYEHFRVSTDDGFTLAVKAAGRGPAVLLANGIGVTGPGLDFLTLQLKDRYRVLAWDYRGAGASRSACTEQQSGGAKPDYTIERHAADGLAVLDGAGVHRAAVLGWSMGVPVGLEMIRQAPDRIAALGALFGAPGRPFEAAFPRPLARLVLRLSKVFSTWPAPPQALLALGAALPRACFQVCARMGFVGAHAHAQTFARNVAAVAAADQRAYFATMSALLEHDARDLLAHIKCPVLVVAGNADWVTPVHAAQEMAQSIAGARFVVLDRATHFGVIECNEVLWTPIAELLASAGDWGKKDTHVEPSKT
jgi:pimeloyl-ACP methyl ester carboxylesterase